MTILRQLTEFKGDKLIIGCGHHCDHHFNLSDNKGVPSTVLHPRNEFYTINDNSLHTDLQPDLIMDFMDGKISSFYGDKKFSFICFERIVSLFLTKETTAACLKQAKRLLTPDGICMIYAGGRHLSPDIAKILISFFKYNYLLTYGIGKTWTLIVSDQEVDFDNQKITANAYFNTLYTKIKSIENLAEQKYINQSAIFGGLFQRSPKQKSKATKDLELIEANTYYLMDESGRLPVIGYSKPSSAPAN